MGVTRVALFGFAWVVVVVVFACGGTQSTPSVTACSSDLVTGCGTAGAECIMDWNTAIASGAFCGAQQPIGEIDSCNGWRILQTVPKANTAILYYYDTHTLRLVAITSSTIQPASAETCVGGPSGWEVPKLCQSSSCCTLVAVRACSGAMDAGIGDAGTGG
jgi:hypothetical protein